MDKGAPYAALLRSMARMRAFEEAAADLWTDGHISGELHLGIGEEGIVAGVVSHLRDGDAMALDHRGTPPLVGRGSDLVGLLLELCGHPGGIGGGNGGHMHLFDRGVLAASSGIVGASGPAACGFALAHRRTRPGAIAVAFLGESATNQGMMLEAWNLAVVWKLPVVFVCKDNGWAISTRSNRMTGGDVLARAESFGLAVGRADGSDVAAVWKEAGRLVDRARGGRPGFLLASCVRPRGHFEGDPMLRRVQSAQVLAADAGQMLRSAAKGGGSIRQRVRGLARVGGTIATAAITQTGTSDPLSKAKRRVDNAEQILEAAADEIAAARNEALATMGIEQ